MGVIGWIVVLKIYLWNFFLYPSDLSKLYCTKEKKYLRFRGRKQHKFVFAHITCLSFIGSVFYFIWSSLRASGWCTLWSFKTPVNRSEERQDKGLCYGSYVIQLGMAHITSAHISVTREHPLVKPNFNVAGKWPLPMLGGRGKWDGYQLHSISVYQRWIKNWVISCYHDKDTRDFNDKTQHLWASIKF